MYKFIFIIIIIMKTILIKIHNDVCKHFWHFTMGELMPVISIICKTQATHVILLNPNRKWGQAFDQFYIDVMVNGSVTFEFKNQTSPSNTIEMYDISNKKWDWDWNQDGKKEFLEAIEWLKKETIEYYKTHTKSIQFKKKKKHHCLIQIRKDNPELTNYFNEFPNSVLHLPIDGKTKQNIKTYGAARRNVRDMESLPKILKNYNISSNILTHDGKHLYQQIYPYIDETNIWLIHGAGMFFTSFMKDKSNVVELITSQKFHEFNGAAQGLKRLANLKQFNHERIIIEHNKSIFSVSIKYYIKQIFNKIVNDKF